MGRLSEEELLALIDNPGRVQQFAFGLLTETQMNTIVTPMADDDIPVELQEIAGKWRNLAVNCMYAGPIAWRVKAGFRPDNDCMFGYFNPKSKAIHFSGRCFTCLPTVDGIYFWIPRLIRDCFNKTYTEQTHCLAELAKSYHLPEDHGYGIWPGDLSLVVALVLAHFKRSGDRIPGKGKFARLHTQHTVKDTLSRESYLRISVGDFVRDKKLSCISKFGDDDRDPDLSCFPVGEGILY